MSFKIKDGVRIGTVDVFNSSGTLLVNAPTATKATNIAGGSGGSIPYQSSVDNTSLLANGSAGQFLKSQGTTLAPIWADIPAAVNVTADNSATTYYLLFTATTTGALTDARVDNATTPLSYVPSTSTLTCSTFSGALSGNASTATSAGKATNLVGGNSTTLLGSIPYQSDTDTTTLLAPNTTSTKKFLRMTGTGTNGAIPAWDTLVDGDIPSALTGKTYNGLTLTAAGTGFTIAGGTSSKTLTVNNSIGISGTDGKTLTLNNNLTFSGTDSSSVAFGTGGTVAYTANNLSIFAATTSAQLAGVISDETGYSAGAYLVFNKAPTFDTSMDASATFAAFASSTSLTIGYNSTSSSTTNISTGAVGSGNTKTINIGTGGGASSTTNINLGSSNGGTVTVNKDLVVGGNLTINGTTTIVNSTTISVDDKNIELGSVAVPDNTTADGGGITLKGATDKTLNWVNATGAWTSSEHIDLASGKAYYINGASVLTSTTLGSAVVNSSLTKVGALSGGTAGFVKVDASGNLTSDSNTYLTSASTLDASKLSGTIPSAVLGNSTVYIGTTSVALNRSSAALALTGISSVTGSTTLDLKSTTTSAVTLDSGTTGAVNIGTSANGKTITIGNSTANTAVNITSAGTGATTITGSVKLPTVGTSGFVKLGAGGALSADTTTYLSTPSTLQQVTTAGASSNVAISLTNTTDATDNSTGALVISGGVAVIKNIFHTATLSSAVAAGTKISDRTVVQASLSTVSATPVDTWAIATYRSVRYTVQITQGTDYQVSEILVIHNGSTTFMTEFAVLETNGALGTFTSDINTGNARLIITMGSATAATINIVKQLIVV